MSEIKVQSGNSFFANLGADVLEGDSKNFPFVLKVLVAGPNVSPRDKMFELMLEMGSFFIDPILNHKPLNVSGGLTFVFPERNMSVHEQYLFLERLKTHPDVGKITSVIILTQNVFIVGGLDTKGLTLFTRHMGDPNASITIHTV